MSEKTIKSTLLERIETLKGIKILFNMASDIWGPWPWEIDRLISIYPESSDYQRFLIAVKVWAQNGWSAKYQAEITRLQEQLKTEN